METPPPSFGARIGIALSAFFRSLSDARFAAQVARVASEGPAPRLRTADPDAALQLLALLQREGRLVDFLLEDMSAYADAEIGAAARVVHGGCRKALAEHVTLEPVRREEEGSAVILDAGFDPAAVRLVGNVGGAPPFRGRLTHRGWRARNLRLPQLAPGHDSSVVAPAEVEL